MVTVIRDLTVLASGCFFAGSWATVGRVNAATYEDDTDELLTEARFDATFADPRNLVGTDTPSDFESQVTGYFRFFYQRGQPAQPFQ